MAGITMFRNSEDTVTFKQGEHLFRVGDEGQYAYVIITGEVDISNRGVHLATLGPDELCGEMALIAPGPRSADCIAKTDVTAVQIDQRRFTFLVQQTPFFAVQVMKITVERLRSANGKIVT